MIGRIFCCFKAALFLYIATPARLFATLWGDGFALLRG